jgi:hypothetical protein
MAKGANLRKTSRADRTPGSTVRAGRPILTPIGDSHSQDAWGNVQFFLGQGARRDHFDIPRGLVGGVRRLCAYTALSPVTEV